MSVSNKLTKSNKILSIIFGAILMGIMWRARGTNGLGSSWGLFAVGSMLTLLIFVFYGNRKNMNFELIPIGAFLMAATVPAWGEVVKMPGGIFYAGNGTDIIGSIPQSKGYLFMLMLGFGLICLYSIFVGTLFSDKEYSFLKYVIFVAIFFASAYIAKATFSHYLLKNIAPEIFESFRNGLKESNINLFPREAYLKHFSDISWAKHITYGRAYYECIEHISYCFAALILCLSALIIFRDKITFLVSLCINVVSAFAITVADYFNICESESSFLSYINIPSALRIESWPLWEFFTGFFIGLGIMLIIALLPNKYSAGKTYRSEPFIKNKIFRFVLNVLLFMFIFVVVPVRNLALKVCENLFEHNFIKSEDTISIIIIAILSIIIAIPVILKFKKNILDRNLPVPIKQKPNVIAYKMLLGFSAFYTLTFALIGSAPLSRFIYRLATSGESFTALLTNSEFAVLPCVVFSFVLTLIIYFPLKKRIFSHH